MQEIADDKVCPSYCIKQIGESDVVEKRELNKLKVFNNIDVSSKFQVVIFNSQFAYVTLLKKNMEVVTCSLLN